MGVVVGWLAGRPSFGAQKRRKYKKSEENECDFSWWEDLCMTPFFHFMYGICYYVVVKGDGRN